MRRRKNQIKKRKALQDISVDVNIQKKHARNNVKEPLKNLKVASLDEKEKKTEMQLLKRSTTSVLYARKPYFLTPMR